MTFSIKIRSIAAMLVVAFAVAVAAGSFAGGAQAQVKSTTTGKDANYCSQVADLINDALDNANSTSDAAEKQAWTDLAVEFTKRAQANGCSFVVAKYLRAGLVVQIKGGTLAKAKTNVKAKPKR